MPHDELRRLLDCIFSVHENEMDCSACNQEIDCLAEKVAAGASLSELWPAMEAHMCVCQDCREEFEALVAILRAESGGVLNRPSE